MTLKSMGHSNGCILSQVEEKMYSVTTPPPDRPGAAYSIARLLKTGER